MTTRTEAEAALFDAVPFVTKPAMCPKGHKNEMSTFVDKPTRRRLDAPYCPHCRGWVEVRLNPVRLHCTGCGLEARP